MYSYEDRIRAVRLYIDCGKSAAVVVRTLGYPSKKNLRRWYKSFLENGDLQAQPSRKPKYSLEQRQKAVDHYFKYGQCLALTRKSLGYPCSATLNLWIDELHPGVKKSITGKAPLTYCSVQQKQRAVIELCSRQGSASDIADAFGVSRQVLYKWKDKLLDERVDPFMKPHKSSQADRDRAVLEEEVAVLQSRVHRLQLEHDEGERIVKKRSRRRLAAPK